MKISRISTIFFILALMSHLGLTAQRSRQQPMIPVYPYAARVRDSITACRVPLMVMPGNYRQRTLPPIVDNSANSHWPGIKDQYQFYTCQQYSGVAYVFGYEINRLRNQPGWYWENSYPTHYTWNFMNQGDRFTGVNFLQSFEAIKQQGHMTSNDYGPDTATSVLGWISGYDKYYRGMFNHIRQVYAIEINSTAGIIMMKNYLFDHLDGSPAGGIACFTTSSGTLHNMPVLPEGTPEAGKSIITRWQSDPVHGMTIVGYNDSIRFDLNNDGKFTNDIDITGDGRIDARDWEIGGFKIANSYGLWWTEDGFVYALYRSFALNYEDGGIWNNRVYVVEADTAYRPLLALRVKLNYNARNKIRILAGMNDDTLFQMPDHVIDFPVFNFQGGEHFMQGNDTILEAKSIEFGLDVTPLLNYIPSGQPARFFLGVEERDPDQRGEGIIEQASFIHYGNAPMEIPVKEQDVIIEDNKTTMVSVVAAFDKPDVRVVTERLPSFTPHQTTQVQLEATGGRPPYDWSFVEQYSKKPAETPAPIIIGTSLMVPSATRSFSAVALPFSFPFFGKPYDTIYVNYFGFIAFEPQNLPAPYITDETAMLRMFPLVVPSFSQQYTYVAGKNDGIWFEADASHAVIRWKTTVAGHASGSSNDFSVILYPDGRFDFCYGTMENLGFTHTFYHGVSKGDGLNSEIETQWNANEITGKSFTFSPPVVPEKISLDRSGLLSVAEADSSVIYSLQVRVADAGRISDSRVLVLSNGLDIVHELICGDDGKLKSGQPASLKLILTNNGTQPLHDLKLKILTPDSLLQITDSLYSVPLINPGQSLTVLPAFSFTMARPLPNDFPVMVSLHALSAARSWNKELVFPVAAPELSVDAPFIVDGFNNRLDPGEVADLAVKVRNSGNRLAQSLQVTLLSADPEVTVLSAPIITIDQLNGYSATECVFRIRASREIQPGNSGPIQILLNDTTGLLQILDFSLLIGTKPVALVNLASSRASFQAMINALDSLHVGFDTISSLPFDYNRYASVFLILGTLGTGSHTLKYSEGSFLAEYLRHGGNLYMESYLTWYYFNKTVLHPYFKYVTQKIPVYHFPQVKGIPGTFTDSMAYAYQVPLNYAIYGFEPVAPAYSTFTNSDDPAKSLEIVYDGSDYKTIGSMLDFSALSGEAAPSGKTVLMRRYLEFFGLNLYGPYPLFHASVTKVCRGQAVTFTDDSFDQIKSWNWEFQGGIPAVSNDTNPVVRYDTGGNFDVKLTVSDGLRTREILKPQYIRVDNCAGKPDDHPSSPWCRIFPNPAADFTTIEINRPAGERCSIILHDLAGYRVREIQRTIPPGNRIVMNLSGLARGLYFIRVQAGGLTSIHKLIKY